MQPSVSRQLLRNVALHTALTTSAFFTLRNISNFVGLAHATLRLTCGILLLYSFMALLSELAQLGHQAVGIEVPPNHRAPIRAQSAQEFWGKRWNRFVSEWLNHFIFLPLSRRHHPMLALFSAFLASAALHAWLAGVALGWPAAVMMGTYFFIQGVLVVAETHLNRSTWPVPVARAWTFLVVLGPSPLGIDPFLRVFGL